MLIQLNSHIGGRNPLLSSHNAFNARLSLLSESLEARPKLLRLLEAFPCFLNFVMVHDIVALEETSSLTVLVTLAHAIRAPKNCPFSNLVMSRILS